ncbi:RDD family protein [Algicola sagamiensis]|uniref:RDD family protein n=1 Tax=Algicola sagamiensis TaxID=163869 RepID=UPI00036077F4|nr:RDD family protein [Algicola sagamiensis]
MKILDTQIEHETPEGITLAIYPAGIAARTLAFTIDILIRIGIIFAASTLFSLFGVMGQGLILITLFVVEWFYPVLFEVFSNGATPGKKVFRLKVVYDNGLPISFSGSLLRNLFRTIDFLPCFYTAGFISMVTNRRFKRIGDWVAGTQVVYDEKLVDTDDGEVKGGYSSKIPLTSEEQEAIIAFQHRKDEFSDDRKEELANMLTPVIDSQGKHAVHRLYQIANRLVGKE